VELIEEGSSKITIVSPSTTHFHCLTSESALDESAAQTSRLIDDQSEEEELPGPLGIVDIWDLFE
jgi:hypothetical protein